MRRHFESLRPADVSALHSVPDGIFLVRVDRAQYRWHKQKPYYEIRFAVLKPKHLTGCFITGRLYCTPKVPLSVRQDLSGVEVMFSARPPPTGQTFGGTRSGAGTAVQARLPL